LRNAAACAKALAAKDCGLPAEALAQAGLRNRNQELEIDK